MSERTSISLSSSCSGLAKCGVPTKPPMRNRGRVLLARRERFREAKVDHLHDQLVVLVNEHQVRRLDVAMHEPVDLRRIQCARDLINDLQGAARAEAVPAA